MVPYRVSNLIAECSGAAERQYALTSELLNNGLHLVAGLRGTPTLGNQTSLITAAESGYRDTAANSCKSLVHSIDYGEWNPALGETVPEIRDPPATSFSTALLFRYSFPCQRVSRRKRSL